MSQPHDSPHDADFDEDIDGCDHDFTEGEQTADEDLPVAFGGEAQ